MKIAWSKWQKVYNRPLTINQAQLYSLSCDKPLAKILGKGFKNQLYIIKKNSADGYFLKDEWQNFNRYILEKCFVNQNFLRNLNTKVLAGSRQLEKFLDYFGQINFEALSDKDLLKKYQEITRIFNKHISYLWVGFILEDVTERKLSNILCKYKLSAQAVETIIALEKPHHIIQERLDLMKIIAFSKNIDSALGRHQKKYSYIPCYSADVEPTSFLQFKKTAQKVSPAKARQIIIDTRKQFKKNKLHFQAFLKNTNFTILDRLFINYFHEAVFLKDYRSHFRSLAMFNLRRLFQEIGRRHHLAISQVSLLLSQDIIALLQERISQSDLIKLIKTREKDEPLFAYINSQEFLLKNSLADRDSRKGSLIQLKGIIANKGQASGIVKIVLNPNDINKVKNGDILISSMTRPDYVPAMKKAAAIVTDEGGLLCHAAIISRELNKPCLVGTQNSTTLFKDGDRVKVDATRGLIKKLS